MAPLHDIAGVALGILLANAVAGAIANVVAGGHAPSWHHALLPGALCALLGAALHYSGYKLVLVIIVPAKVPCGPPPRRVLAVAATPIALLALAGIVYAASLSQVGGWAAACAPGMVESLLAATTICAVILPFLPARFLAGAAGKRTLSGIASAATALLILSGAYAQLQSEGVDFLGTWMAMLVRW